MMCAHNRAGSAETMIAALRSSRKYRDTLGETIRAVVAEEMARHKSARDAEKAARKRLHNIMAPYLGDPDYARALACLRDGFAAGDDDMIGQTCLDILKAHDSTEERLPILERFYDEIFRVTGLPHSVLDVACGLNPLAFRWMGLPRSTQFYAYDIHQPRVEFIQAYFDLEGVQGAARLQDIALRFPEEEGDMALFLKEMPRFERNYGKRGLALLQALRVRWLIISFPTVSLHGGRSLVALYRRYFSDLIAGQNWRVTEILFDSEMVFCVDKA